MSPSRPLLRLDEKVAAETRRLAALGGPPRPAAIFALAAAAAAVHAGLAALPLPAPADAPPAMSAPPDLPTVWRWGPPSATPVPTPAGPSAKAPAGPGDAPLPPGAGLVGPPGDFEPVPEPPPDLPASAISADLEALIPAPAPVPGGAGGPQGPSTAADPAPDPVPVVRVNPVYPIAARSLRAEGSVALDLTVRPDGSVEDAAVTRCTRPGVGFEDAALAAVRRWRYPPVVGGGARRITVHVDFRGQEGRP